MYGLQLRRLRTHAEVYDDNGAPFCLLCLNVRDRKSRVQYAAIGDRTQSAREESTWL
jgi:hypothetical protein